MGIFDRSASNTQLTETNTQETDARSYGQQGNEGIGLAGEFGGNVEIQIDQVDSGVVAAAVDLGSGALALAGDTVANALRANGDVSRYGFDLASRSLTTVAGLAGDSIDAQNKITEYALQNSESVTRSAISTLSSAIASVANASRSDASEVLSNITKYGFIALAVAAVAFAFRKGKSA